MRRTNGPRLVVRRGQAFRLKVALSRRYYRDRDAISFIFMVTGESLLLLSLEEIWE